MAEDPMIVEREDVRVLFRRTNGDQESITTRIRGEREAATGSLSGRKFDGVFGPGTKEYQVCVQWKDGDDAGALGAIVGVGMPANARGAAASRLPPHPADDGASGWKAEQRPVTAGGRVLPSARRDRPPRSGRRRWLHRPHRASD